jgi:adenine deaminase
VRIVTVDEENALEATRALMEVALGRRPPDLRLVNGRLVNVYSGEILEGQEVRICGTRMAYVGPPAEGTHLETESIDVEGSFLVPGFIDAHAHVDFFANPLSLTPQLLASGTTALMADPHDAVGALGIKALEMLVEMTRGLPLKFFFSVPVATPPLPELEGDPVLTQEEVESCLLRPEIRAISEVTSWPRVISGDEDLLRKFAVARLLERRIEGHTTGASYRKLSALAAGGITSCHEAINAQEALDRLRLGLYVMLRHGSIRQDLEPLAEFVTGESSVDTSRIMLTPDWMDPPSILERGYMDSLVRGAIEQGISPIAAIQMATVNPARYLGLDTEIGGIAPGRLADVLVIDDLREVKPRIVIANGRIVARDGEAVTEQPSLPAGALRLAWLPHRVLPRRVEVTDFEVGSPAASSSITVPAIHILNRTITERHDVSLPVRDGHIELPDDGDVLKVALLNAELPGFTTAFLTGLGAPIGGLVSSLGHEPHRPLVIGCRGEDMVLAFQRMMDLGGGLVLAHDGEVLSEIPLPIGGVMSVEPLEVLAGQIRGMNGLLQDMGCRLDNPVFTIGFLTFSTLPWIRLTPRGLRDVKSGRVIWPVSAS